MSGKVHFNLGFMSIIFWLTFVSYLVKLLMKNGAISKSEADEV